MKVVLKLIVIFSLISISILISCSPCTDIKEKNDISLKQAQKNIEQIPTPSIYSKSNGAKMQFRIPKITKYFFHPSDGNLHISAVIEYYNPCLNSLEIWLSNITRFTPSEGGELRLRYYPKIGERSSTIEIPQECLLLTEKLKWEAKQYSYYREEE